MTFLRCLSFAALSAFLCVCAAPSASAQIFSIYGTYSPVRVSGVETGIAVTPISSQTQYTDFWAHGFGGGVTLNFLPLPVVSLGLDFRGSTRPGTVGADTAMVGIKLGVHPPAIRIKPYIQGSVGYLATRTINVTSTTNALGATTVVGGTFGHQYAAYEILGGIDYPLMHFIDYRIIEIGGGQVILNGANNPSLFTINTGVVLHF